MFSLVRVPREDKYYVDQGACVACARCYLSCPREHLRLKRLRGLRPADGSASHTTGERKT